MRRWRSSGDTSICVGPPAWDEELQINMEISFELPALTTWLPTNQDGNSQHGTFKDKRARSYCNLRGAREASGLPSLVPTGACDEESTWLSSRPTSKEVSWGVAALRAIEPDSPDSPTRQSGGGDVQSRVFPQRASVELRRTRADSEGFADFKVLTAGLVSPSSKRRGGRLGQRSQDSKIDEVRALRHGSDTDVPKDGHEVLVRRLKSHGPRLEAETTKVFLALCRSSVGSQSPVSFREVPHDARLDDLIAETSARVEKLVKTTDDAQKGILQYERRLEQARRMSVPLTNEAELQRMSLFQRNQHHIEQKKREDDMAGEIEEATATLARLRNQLHQDSIELRDYRLLGQEYAKVRFETLQRLLLRVRNGTSLRACLREMIRLDGGGKRLVSRLESTGLPMEPWMREAMVNMCHTEVLLEKHEADLFALRREAVAQKRDDLHAMMSSSRQGRFDQLCAQTWSVAQGPREEASESRADRSPERNERAEVHFSSLGYSPAGTLRSEARGEKEHSKSRQKSETRSTSCATLSELGASPRARSTTSATQAETASPQRAARSSSVLFLPSVRDGAVGDDCSPPTCMEGKAAHVAPEIRAAEGSAAQLRRLLDDTRQNIAAIICNRMSQAKLQGASETDRHAWAQAVLHLMVSEEFANATLKQLKKRVERAELGY